MRRNNVAETLHRRWVNNAASSRPARVPNRDVVEPTPKRTAGALRLLPGGAVRSPSDEDLVAAVQSGDQRVARHLYERLHRIVDHTLYRIFGARETDHDDMMQAAFEQIVVTLGKRTYAGDCSLRTWAASITSHVAFNALRARKRERRVIARCVPVEDDGIAAPKYGDNHTAARLELRRIQKHLLAMKTEQAETLFLCDVLDHRIAEVARLTHVSVAAATSRLVRGRRELQRRLATEQKAERFR